MRLPKNAQIWLPGYVRGRLASFVPRGGPAPLAVWLTFADHFEPYWRNAAHATALVRVNAWIEKWPSIAARHAGRTGKLPKYTFFYPEEQYRPELLDRLAGLAQAGLADVEVHLHHDSDSEQNFLERMGRFTEKLRARHGLLRVRGGRNAFGFIHGNWALDNSLPGGRWCGLNNEIALLARLGCYADFTLPSAPSPAQTSTVNCIYWAQDDPARPKSHDRGCPVLPGAAKQGELMIVPGPLGLNWRRRKGGLLPRLETGELASYNRSSPQRAKLWLRFAPRIGRHVFLKLFSHGAQESNANALLGGGLDEALTHIADECRRLGLALHVVSAWEMFQAIEAVREGAPAGAGA